MGSVHQLSSTSEELGRFLDYLFGNETGIAYSPTLEPLSKRFEQYFFEWPVERVSLIRHIETMKATHEVYLGPALRKSASALKDDVKVSNVVWVEFDGTLPIDMKNAPEPTLKIKSSTEGHEHWYWKLENSINNYEALENITKRLAYALGADFTWDASRVLRPPGTIHHESGNTVTVQRWDLKLKSLKDFADLPDIPVSMIDESDIRMIPPVMDVLMKYSWPTQEDRELFLAREVKKDGKGGGRSAALSRLGHIGVEIGMKNSEILAILLNADERWGKYKGRADQKKRLIGIINYCRTRHAVDPVGEEVISPFKVYTYSQFMEAEFKVDWLIPELLHRKGIGMVVGPQAVGKSQFMMRFCEKLAKGEPFLKWQPEKPLRTIYVSMEMPSEEIKSFWDVMKLEGNPLLLDNMLIMPVGAPINLNDKKTQEEINRAIEEFQPDGIVFDSFGASVDGNINEKGPVHSAMEYVTSKIRREYNMFTWFIHHLRKNPDGKVREPQSLDDAYGSGYITTNVTTGMLLWGKPGDEILKIKSLKLRLSKPYDPFYIKRSNQIEFTVSHSEFADKQTISMPSGLFDI